MGKGKGTFEYWATRYVSTFDSKTHVNLRINSCATGKVLFEIGGGGLREELAREGMSFSVLAITVSSTSSQRSV